MYNMWGGCMFTSASDAWYVVRITIYECVRMSVSKCVVCVEGSVCVRVSVVCVW